jgi:hypothetical protein
MRLMFLGEVLTTETLVAFKITGVENNHTDNPIVRPGRLKVEM